MKTQSHWLEKFLPTLSEEYGDGITRGYKRFSKGLSIILLILVLAPLTLISILAHYQYKQLLHDQEMAQLVLNLEETQNTIEAFVSELLSTVKLVGHDVRYEELLLPKELETLFVRLQQEFPGVTDIEIIGSAGTQKAYYGPGTLEAHSYTDQVWYREVLLHGVHVSNIVTNLHRSPYFAIAVSREHPEQQKHWVLRVSIEAKTLQDFIDTIRTSYTDDMFLIDSKHIAQTQPQKFGHIGEKCILHDTKDKTELQINGPLKKQDGIYKRASDMLIVQKTSNGQKINIATVSLLNTPWKLVLIKEQYLHATTWTLFKIKLTVMFFACIIVAVFLILEISAAITNHLREADKKWQQLYIEAEQRDKLASIGRLAAGIAHEINNPLSIINQKTGLVQDFMEMMDDFEYKEMMTEAHESIQKNVNRCKTITHRLLGFARVADVQTEEIDINTTIREVIDFLAKEAMYSQIKIAFDLDQSVSKIVSDRGPLQQIFLNITNNAIDAIEHHGTITLSTKQLDQDNIQVSISDDGPGIPKDVLKRIFEPFFTTKETGKGTGLGLSITYGLVRKLGGHINVKTEAGLGTTFEITLPVEYNK
jgi:two-component system NtrC family sensor kinase